MLVSERHNRLAEPRYIAGFVDLSERSAEHTIRHPWEIARARAVQRVLARAGGPLGDVLDFGCGDGYMGLFLLERLHGTSYVGYDSQLTDDQCRAWSSADRRITFVNTEPGPNETFTTVLACDVIEHVPDDVQLLRTAWSHVRSRGRLLVTVPAFQALFSRHDRALRHYRRYSLSQLRAALSRSDLPVLASGYLFASLLIPRLVSTAVERLGRRPHAATPAATQAATQAATHAANDQDAHALGVGHWTMPAFFSSLIAGLFRIENDALLSLAWRGLKLPGLSAWALTVKPDHA